MSNIAKVALGDICEVNIGRTPARENREYWGVGFPWLSIADMNQGRVLSKTKEQITQRAVVETRMQPAPTGTVLLSFKLSIGKVGIAATPLFTNEAIAALPIKDPTKLIPEFLFWALQSIDLTAGQDRAAMGLTLNKAKLLTLQIPLPPLKEQRRIAAILDQAETLRTQRRTALALLDSLTQSLFLDMFGDPVANPKGLPICELQRLCTRITDGTHQSPVWQKSGIPFLFISNIVEGQINFDTHKFISADTHAELTKRCPIEIGDVLYTTVGSYGNAAVVSTEKPFAFQRHIAHIKPDRSKLDSRFLAAMIQSPGVRQQVDKLAKGIAQKTVNLADLKGLSVFAPPLPLQQTFATRIASIEALKATHRRALAALDALFAALQQRAFAGQL